MKGIFPAISVKFVAPVSKFDKVIILGDYFDNFDDTEDQNIKMAQLLKDRFLYNNKYVCKKWCPAKPKRSGTNHMYYVYILLSAVDNSKYIGVTENLKRRFA